MKIIRKRIKTICFSVLLLLAVCLIGACGPREEENKENTQKRTLEITFDRDEETISGRLYLPEGEGPFPAVIICHGFGGNMQYLLQYGRFFQENGIAACAFDFVGGGPSSASGGSMMEMSVLTEEKDLEAVLDGLSARPEIDEENIFLIGSSHGGFIATMTAAKRPDDVKGLISLYPGYGIQDYLKTLPDENGELPESVEMLGNTVSRMYIEDALSVDIHSCMSAYPGPVLIIHGTADRIAPYFYSIRATQYFPDAQLVPIEGAGHVFQGEDDDFAMETMLTFISEHLN